ncbi:MAG TPA: EamA family transporter [Solirubrobacteraceae bacterium]|nr:EamA family transporter [Solirubrobacteraceae bacterium]
MRRAVLLLLAAGTIIQFGAAFAISLFDRLGPGGMVFLRLAFAAVALLVIFRPAISSRSPRDLRVVGLFGLVLGAMNWSFYEALDRIPLGTTVTLEFVGPLGVAVWGSRRPRDLVWVALAAAAVILLAEPFSGGGDLDPVGVGLAFVAGGCWAAYILLSARVGRDWPAASGLAIAMAVAALVALPAGVAQGGGALLEPELLAAGLLVAFACSVIPYSLEMEALRTLPEGVFGVMMSLEPAIAAFAGFLVLGQGLRPADAVAIGLVVVASAGAAATVRSRQPAAVLAPP